MADYTYQELMRMQSDAVKRVEDMQRRARSVAGIERESTSEAPHQLQRQEPHHIPQPEGYLPRPAREENDSPESNDNRHKISDVKRGFDKMEVDDDKALILSLLLLLSGESADEGLLTALIYMLT